MSLRRLWYAYRSHLRLARRLRVTPIQWQEFCRRGQVLTSYKAARQNARDAEIVRRPLKAARQNANYLLIGRKNT